MTNIQFKSWLDPDNFQFDLFCRSRAREWNLWVYIYSCWGWIKPATNSCTYVPFSQFMPFKWLACEHMSYSTVLDLKGKCWCNWPILLCIFLYDVWCLILECWKIAILLPANFVSFLCSVSFSTKICVFS